MTGPRPAWLSCHPILAASGGLADTAASWRSYQEYLALEAIESPEEREHRFARLCQGWAIGSPDFQDELTAKLEQQIGRARDFALLGNDATGVRHARAQVWEHQLVAIAEAAGIELAGLPRMKSTPQKVLLAALLKQVASVSNRWIGGRLQMGGASSVSSLVTRFHRQGLDQTAEFRALYSRFAI